MGDFFTCETGAAECGDGEVPDFGVARGRGGKFGDEGLGVNFEPTQGGDVFDGLVGGAEGDSLPWVNDAQEFQVGLGGGGRSIEAG